MLLPTSAIAEAHDDRSEKKSEHEPAAIQFYRSPEERREAGLGTQVTDWLKVLGVIEFETSRVDTDFDDGSSVREKDRPVKNLQLGLDFSFSEDFVAELIFETEKAEHSHSKIDEALISYDWQDWGFSLGKLYVPFGQYYSQFVSGPLLEFAETRATALVVDYSFTETIEVAFYVMDSDKGRSTDWGVAVEIKSADESMIFGSGYISDLGESEENLLAEIEPSAYRRVDGFNVYSSIGYKQFIWSFEAVAAIDDIDGFDPETNRPSAWNSEVAYFIQENLRLAARIERSDELEEQPEKRYGLSLTWLPTNNLSLGIDYLWGDYKPGFVSEDGEDDDQDDKKFSAIDSNYIEFMVSFEF